MATTAVAAPTMHQSRTNNSWRLSFNDRRSPLIDRRLSTLVHQPSSRECITRRKSAGNLRRRHSWRLSWKNALTKSFQNLGSARAIGLREKEQTSKKRSSESLKNFSKNSVISREKMAKTSSSWNAEIVDSSEDSSYDTSDEEEDCFLLGSRRSSSPRIISSESSSSEDENNNTAKEEVKWDVPVSLYVSEGPSRMIVSTNPDETAKQTPDVNNSEDAAENPGAKSSSGSRRSSSLRETGGQPASPVNFNPDVLTGNHEAINYGQNSSVIAPLQIFDHEGFGDKSKQIKHPFSISCEKLGAGNHFGVEKPREESRPRKAYHDAVKTRCGSSLGGQSRSSSSQEELLVKTSDQRFGLLSPQEVCHDGVIETTRKDALSVSLQNKHLATEKEQLMKESHNEERSLEELQSLGQGGDQVNITSEMEDLFSTQDLNAIRRFLGMSLQQLDANKVLAYDSVEHPYPAVVSLGNLRKIGNEQQPSHEYGHGIMENKDVLPDYPSTYPQKNKGTIPSSEQIFSSDGDQPSELHCDFKDFGCAFPGTRRVLQLENHMKSNVGEHLKLVTKTANEQKEQLNDQRLLQEKQGFLIRQLTETVRKLKDLVQDQHKKRESQQKVIHSLKEQLREQRKQSQRFERDISRQFQTLSQSTSAPLTTVPSSSSSAEMLWPFKNFRKCLQRVREGEIDDPFISEPFYSGTCGYKLSIWVYVNGRGRNLGSCISVYARVMPGEYDTILSWPVRPVYTFTLFDQSEGEKDNIVRTRKVNDIKRNGGKQHGIDRPGGGDRSVIVGFDDFITHDQLDKRNYLVDDCLFIKINAEF